MKITFDIKLTHKDLFAFNMYQAYKGMQGVLAILASILFLYIAYKNYQSDDLGGSVLYIVLILMLIGYTPISLWFRCKKLIKTNESLAAALHYEFAAENIKVSQGEKNVDFLWENIYKMIATKNMVFVYTNRINAYIIPKCQIQNEYRNLAELAKKSLPKYRVKMK